MIPRLLLTGAAGKLGRHLRSSLRPYAQQMRLSDIAAMDAAGPGEELQPCSDEERWMTETVYATKKEGRKSAIRLFKTIEEATELAEKEKGYVETRQGEPKRCTGDFCGVSKWCKQYQGEINVPA